MHLKGLLPDVIQLGDRRRDSTADEAADTVVLAPAAAVTLLSHRDIRLLRSVSTQDPHGTRGKGSSRSSFEAGGRGGTSKLGPRAVERSRPVAEEVQAESGPFVFLPGGEETWMKTVTFWMRRCLVNLHGDGDDEDDEALIHGRWQPSLHSV